MTCDQAQPYLSALYDAEPIPPEAADHAAHCARCQDQLQQYAQTSAALRSYASQFVSQPVPPRTWLKTSTATRTRWWEKANQSMRIPRLAFAALVLVLVALSSRGHYTKRQK
jgi:anti-sigma factor RsiW